MGTQQTKPRPTLAEIRGWPATVDAGQAAAALGISRSYAYQLIRAGEFPVRTLQVGGKTSVVTASLLALLNGE